METQDYNNLVNMVKSINKQSFIDNCDVNRIDLKTYFDTVRKEENVSTYTLYRISLCDSEWEFFKTSPVDYVLMLATLEGSELLDHIKESATVVVGREVTYVGDSGTSTRRVFFEYELNNKLNLFLDGYAISKEGILLYDIEHDYEYTSYEFYIFVKNK